MTIALNIRQALSTVALLRDDAAQQPALFRAIHAVKTLQAQRFAGTYADILSKGEQGYGPAARFFMTELYSARDYSERDAQFARIARTLENLFPAKVGALALTLANLHALTEQLDHAMGEAWAAAHYPVCSVAASSKRPTSAVLARAYTQAWCSVGRSADRHAQLRTVLGIGEALGRLTRTPGLRQLIRLMRGPAQAANLGTLQFFLEQGFDTFADLAKVRGGVTGFLALIESREAALIEQLFAANSVACETALEHGLGQVP